MHDQELHEKVVVLAAADGKTVDDKGMIVGITPAEFMAYVDKVRTAGVESESDRVHAERVEADESAQAETEALHARAMAILREGGLMFSYDDDQYAQALAAATVEHEATAEMIALHGHVMNGIDMSRAA